MPALNWMRRRARGFSAPRAGIQPGIPRRKVMPHAKVVKKSIESPDETRAFPNGSGSVRVLGLGDQTVGYMQFKPGWRWSKDMKPVAGTESCQVDHHIYITAGRMV